MYTPILIKRVISIAESFEASAREEREYWLAQTPQERLRHVETLRRMNYGYRATTRLQRVLEVVERTTT